MKTVKLLLIGIVLFKVNFVYAQDSHFLTHFKIYNHSNSSISDDCILKMQKDSKGKLWILTKNGLNVNNGKKWSKVNNFSTSKRFKDFLIDHNDMMWLISAEGSEIITYDLNEEWNTGNSVIGNQLLFFSGETKNDNVYVMSSKGYLYFNSNSRKNYALKSVVISPSILYRTTEARRIDFNATNLELKQKHSLKLLDNDNLIYSRGYEDKNGTIWIGTYFNGIFSVTKDKVNQYKRFTNPVWAFTEDTLGNLLIGTWGEGVFIKEQHSEEFIRLELTGMNLTDLNINTVLCDQQNVLWIGTAEKGVIKIEDYDQLIKEKTSKEFVKKRMDETEKEVIEIKSHDQLIIKEKTNKEFVENKIPTDNNIDITLYPNPVKENVSVRYNSNIDRSMQVKIYHILGSEVLSHT